MRGKQKPADKKKIVERLRRFINGEDLIEEIMPLSNGLAVLSADELNKLRILTDYKRKFGFDPIESFSVVHNGVTITRNELVDIAAKVKGAVAVIPDNFRDRPNPAEEASKNGVTLWAEDKTYKTYPDYEIPDVRYSNPANMLVVDDKGQILENIEVSEHSDKIKTDARKEARNALRRQKLDSRKLEAQQIIKISKARRDQANQFMQMNREFISGWF